MLMKVGNLSVFAIVVFTSWAVAQSMAGNPENGKTLYTQHCFRCHGAALEGNGPEGQYLIIRPANLASLRSRSKPDWELLMAISQGVLFSPMHGWRDRLTDQEIIDVLAYIRAVAPPEVIT